jgi:hypothetical protein
MFAEFSIINIILAFLIIKLIFLIFNSYNMNFQTCSNCSSKATCKCRCNNEFYCLTHFIAHSKQGMSHGVIEILNALDPSSYSSLSAELKSRISTIVSIKFSIATKTSALIQSIISLSSASIHRLDDTISHYIDLLKSNNYDDRTLAEVELVLNSKLKFKDHSIESLNNELSRWFNRTVVSEDDQRENQRRKNEIEDILGEMKRKREGLVSQLTAIDYEINETEAEKEALIKEEEIKKTLKEMNLRIESENKRISMIEERKISVEDDQPYSMTKSLSLSYQCNIGIRNVGNSSSLQEKITFCTGAGLKDFKEKVLDAKNSEINEILFTSDNRLVFICDYKLDCTLHIRYFLVRQYKQFR